MSSPRYKPARRQADKGGAFLPGPKLDPLPVVAAPWWHWGLAVLIVVVAAVIVYQPTLDNDFVTWDDTDYILKNEYLPDPGGLAKIWDPRVKQQQYYPMVFSSYWLEYRYWKLDPKGYHLTNLVLHAINAGLLVLALRLLGVSPWVAWLTAGLFAVHPINVASVSWAAERKNVLSGFCYLLLLIFYLRDVRRPSWANYTLCMLFYVCSLLSKTACVTFPATALLCERLINRRWSLEWRTVARLAPMLALGMGAAWLTSHIEKQNAGMGMVPLEVVLRPLAAAGAIWFYIGKVFVPVNFPGVYPRWELMGPAKMLFLAGLLAVPLAVILIWKLRRRISEHAIWGGAHYVVSLSPMLGLIAFNYTQFSFVADHFVYLPCIGVFLAIAMGARYLARRLGDGRKSWAPITAVGCAVLVALGAISWRQNVRVWRTAETFWVYTLERNPMCWGGQYNLGNLYNREAQKLMKEGKRHEAMERYAQAVKHYRVAEQAKPDLYPAYTQRAEILLQRFGDAKEAAEDFRRIIEVVAARPGIEYRRRESEYRQRLAAMLMQDNRAAEAEEELHKSLKAYSGNAKAHVTLARLLRGRGELEEAVKHYETALQITPDMPAVSRELAAAKRSLAEPGASPPGT